MASLTLTYVLNTFSIVQIFMTFTHREPNYVNKILVKTDCPLIHAPSIFYLNKQTKKLFQAAPKPLQIQ